MAKLSRKQFNQMALKWLEKKGWQNAQDKLEYLLEKYNVYMNYIPDFLVEKDGCLFLVNIFDKEDYYPSSKGYWVTGMDWWKYQMLLKLQGIINIPSLLVFYSETDKEFISGELDIIGKPDQKWHINQCLRSQQGNQALVLKCAECRQKCLDEYFGWKEKVDTFHKCILRKTKLRPMALWNVERFPKDRIIKQHRLFSIRDEVKMEDKKK